MTVSRQDGPKIRSLREKAGVGPGELAKRVGIHRDALANIELGHKPAGVETLTKIALALGVPLADIVRPGTDLHTALIQAGGGSAA